MVAVRVEDDEGVGDGVGGPVQHFWAVRGQCEQKKNDEERDRVRGLIRP